MKKFAALLMVLVLCLCSLPAMADVADVKLGVILLHDEDSTYDLNFINGVYEAMENLGLEEDQVIMMRNIPESDACYEAALELVKRGHRLVSDDVVEIRKVSDETLVGSAPEITKYFIELRGIGIIDVKALFGVESVIDTQSIDMVIQLEEWDKNKEYDRLGMEEQYIEYLGNKVVCHKIPVRPGRNLAIIVESAAVNYRQKKMGYNAAHELYRRVQDNMARKNAERNKE